MIHHLQNTYIYDTNKNRVKSGLFHISMEDTEVNENNEYLYFIRHEYRQQKIKELISEGC